MSGSVDMEVDEGSTKQVNESGGITKPKSAYQYHSQIRCPVIKDNLIAEGKNASMGIVVQTVASIWRAMSLEDKQLYLDMAAKDRERYNDECAQRDAEAFAEQEARRKNNAITGFSTSRMRNSTMASTEVTERQQSAPKRKREESQASKEDKTRRRKERKEELQAVEMQMRDIEASRMEQVEARLKYLLSQSDIFAHFGAGSSSSSSSSSSSQNKDANTKEPKRRSRRSSTALDEDERDFLGDEMDEGQQLLSQPSIITGGTLRPYQLEGLNWVIRLIENGINGILADEMGLGKTLQSISVIAYLNQYQDIPGPHLIMVPKSTLSNWMGEFKRWCPSIRTLKFHGTKEEREEISLNELRPGRTQKELVNLEKHTLMKIGWRFLIVDEAHRLKNEASQFAQNIRLLQTQHRLLLTGTPLQNNLHELWALLNFLLPDVFTSAEQFDEWFNLDVDDTEAKERIIQQLHKLLRPFMMRRLKVDVEKTLPPKTETILFIGLSEAQKQVYKQVLLRDIDTINAGNKEKSDSSGRTAILNIVMQLRKCCNHPYLFPGTEDRTQNPLGDHLYLNCGKMVLLHKLLDKLFKRKNRVLIFSQMTRMLDILEDYLFSQGFKYCRIDGNTTYDEREDRIQAFNAPNTGGLGINLQTADTVILYDSDWNPQADLQAQDRAHRIGQTKPVQVFRLVTEDTIEVKVVERAQQKLKLDAMVVQQGRLQDNQKRMSKTELLDTLRYGADKVFRSTSSDITDADIDLILEEGRKKTEQMNSSLTTADKGDLYDFSLDGNMHSQEFEDEDLSALTMAALLEPVAKRERKNIIDYSEAFPSEAAPKQIRMPRMEEWHFFNKERIIEIFQQEKKAFDDFVDDGEIPVAVNGRLPLLPPEIEIEKRQLLSQAFGDWTRVQFNAFIRGCAKYGRNEFDKISKEVVRPVDDIMNYAKVFWDKGLKVFGQAEWDRTLKQIEKGEARLQEVERVTSATARFIENYENSWQKLPILKGVATTTGQRSFNSEEDRFLLCLTHLYGHGAWDLIRTAVRRSEHFRFNFFLQSCSEDSLARRCESLMRAAQKELGEIEARKYYASIESGNGHASSQLGVDAVDQALAVETAAQIAARVAAVTSGTSNADGSTTRGYKKPSGRPVAKHVPEGILPGLTKLLVASQAMGISGVVAQFVAKHPTISKRQIELKIAEIAVKEKHEKDPTKVWHIRPDFQHLLERDDFDENASPSEGPGAGANNMGSALSPVKTEKPVEPRKPFAIYAAENWKSVLAKIKYSNCKTSANVKALLARAWDDLGEEGQAKYVSATEEEERNLRGVGLEDEAPDAASTVVKTERPAASSSPVINVEDSAAMDMEVPVAAGEPAATVTPPVVA
eukprot:GSChrysophyteH2.ASY1.ANO1.520.1 assembled CDS